MEPAVRADLHARICSGITQRAHAFIAELQARGIEPSPIDFERLMVVAATARLEADDNQRAREVDFRDQVIRALHTKFQREPETHGATEFYDKFAGEVDRVLALPENP